MSQNQKGSHDYDPECAICNPRQPPIEEEQVCCCPKVQQQPVIVPTPVYIPVPRPKPIAHPIPPVPFDSSFARVGPKQFNGHHRLPLNQRESNIHGVLPNNGHGYYNQNFGGRPESHLGFGKGAQVMGPGRAEFNNGSFGAFNGFPKNLERNLSPQHQYSSPCRPQAGIRSNAQFGNRGFGQYENMHGPQGSQEGYRMPFGPQFDGSISFGSGEHGSSSRIRHGGTDGMHGRGHSPSQFLQGPAVGGPMEGMHGRGHSPSQFLQGSAPIEGMHGRGPMMDGGHGRGPSMTDGMHSKGHSPSRSLPGTAGPIDGMHVKGPMMEGINGRGLSPMMEGINGRGLSPMMEGMHGRGHNSGQFLPGAAVGGPIDGMHVRGPVMGMADRGHSPSQFLPGSALGIPIEGMHVKGPMMEGMHGRGQSPNQSRLRSTGDFGQAGINGGKGLSSSQYLSGPSVGLIDGMFGVMDGMHGRGFNPSQYRPGPAHVLGGGSPSRGPRQFFGTDAAQFAQRGLRPRPGLGPTQRGVSPRPIFGPGGLQRGLNLGPAGPAQRGMPGLLGSGSPAKLNYGPSVRQSFNGPGRTLQRGISPEPFANGPTQRGLSPGYFGPAPPSYRGFDGLSNARGFSPRPMGPGFGPDISQKGRPDPNGPFQRNRSLEPRGGPRYSLLPGSGINAGGPIGLEGYREPFGHARGASRITYVPNNGPQMAQRFVPHGDYGQLARQSGGTAPNISVSFGRPNRPAPVEYGGPLELSGYGEPSELGFNGLTASGHYPGRLLGPGQQEMFGVYRPRTFQFVLPQVMPDYRSDQPEERQANQQNLNFKNIPIVMQVSQGGPDSLDEYRQDYDSQIPVQFVQRSRPFPHQAQFWVEPYVVQPPELMQNEHFVRSRNLSAGSEDTPMQVLDSRRRQAARENLQFSRSRYRPNKQLGPYVPIGELVEYRQLAGPSYYELQPRGVRRWPSGEHWEEVYY